MTQAPLPRLSAEISHHHSHNSTPPELSVEKDISIALATEQSSLGDSPITVPTIYKYLEWTTQPGELYSFPERLPSSVTKQTDPFTWNPKQKRMILALACYSTGMAGYSGGAYTSGLDQMSVEWGVSRVALLVGVTTFTTGFAIAPLLLAPLSEVSQFQDRIMARAEPSPPLFPIYISAFIKSVILILPNVLGLRKKTCFSIHIRIIQQLAPISPSAYIVRNLIQFLTTNNHQFAIFPMLSAAATRVCL